MCLLEFEMKNRGNFSGMQLRWSWKGQIGLTENVFLGLNLFILISYHATGESFELLIMIEFEVCQMMDLDIVLFFY